MSPSLEAPESLLGVQAQDPPGSNSWGPGQGLGSGDPVRALGQLLGGGGGGTLPTTPASDSLPETLWKPVIWAQPNFMVPKGRPVTIWCQGARGAVEYQLYFEGRLLALERQKSPGVMSKVKFSLSAMTPFTVWQYSCLYQSGELWSETSDPLDLVVTGKCPVLQP